MIVKPEKKALIMALRNPNKVLTVLPQAKLLVSKQDRSVVAVKHTLDVFKVLTNIGLKPPHPIKFYYDFPTRYDAPMSHQVETAAFLSANTRAYCLNGMGSAKTLSSLWAFDYLRSLDKVDVAIVLAPLSTLERTWSDEVFHHLPHLEAAVVHGTAARRRRVLDTPADVYVINHDGIGVVLTELLQIMKHRRAVLIVDELAVFRNARTNRWKACDQLVKASVYAWGLTGTPIPNDPSDAYGQIKLITPKNAPRSFTMFQDLVSQPVGPYKRVPRINAVQTVHTLMQPAIRYATRDCIDLPPTLYVERHVELSPTQMKAFKQMQDQKVFQATAGGARIIAINEAVVAMKLVQIACGAVYVGEDQEPARIESPERMAVVEEVIGEAEGKVIVFCPVLAALDYIADTLRAKGHAVGQIDGRVAKHDRDRIFSEFQGEGIDVIVAQPGAMSHGLTLTKGNVIIWYAPCYSNETYEQANARIVRPGQKRNTLIVNIEGTGLERGIYARLKSRQKVQGELLELARNS